MKERYIVTPFGLRLDYLTVDGELLYSKYVASRLGGPSPAKVWRQIALVSVALLAIQTAATGLLPVA